MKALYGENFERKFEFKVNSVVYAVCNEHKLLAVRHEDAPLQRHVPKDAIVVARFGEVIGGPFDGAYYLEMDHLNRRLLEMKGLSVKALEKVDRVVSKCASHAEFFYSMMLEKPSLLDLLKQANG